MPRVKITFTDFHYQPGQGIGKYIPGQAGHVENFNKIFFKMKVCNELR